MSDDKSALSWEKVNSKTKLVRQTCDGAIEWNDVQTKWKEKGFKYGAFIHCHVHLVLSRNVWNVNEINIFVLIRSHLHSFSKIASLSKVQKNIFGNFNIDRPSLCYVR